MLPGKYGSPSSFWFHLINNRVRIITVIWLITFLDISIKMKQDFWSTKNSSPAFLHLATIYDLRWKREKKTLSLKLYYARWIQISKGLFYMHVGSISPTDQNVFKVKDENSGYLQFSSIVLVYPNFYFHPFLPCETLKQQWKESP